MNATAVRGLPMLDCRDCAAPIRFVALDTGSALPVDPLPGDTGNVCARVIGGRLHGWVISKTHPAEAMLLRFTAHHATCEAGKKKHDPEPGAPALF